MGGDRGQYGSGGGVPGITSVNSSESVGKVKWYGGRRMLGHAVLCLQAVYHVSLERDKSD